MQDRWHYFSIDGRRGGPVSLAELQQLAASGQLRPADFVWKAGLANWAPAHSVPGLLPAAALTPPRGSGALATARATWQ
jgi:hypothetical protein